jgi:hypothetical protein
LVFEVGVVDVVGLDRVEAGLLATGKDAIGLNVHRYFGVRGDGRGQRTNVGIDHYGKGSFGGGAVTGDELEVGLDGSYEGGLATGQEDGWMVREEEDDAVGVGQLGEELGSGA